MNPEKALPSYLDQSDAVRERFERLKERPKILEVKGLDKVFETPKGETVALKDIHFDTHRREFLCVVGPSGCGKSTLIRILAGLDAQSKAMARKMSSSINANKNLEELKKQLAGLEAQMEQAGAKAPPAMKVIRTVLRNRIAELEKK